jgi:hypothetical protein
LLLCVENQRAIAIAAAPRGKRRNGGSEKITENNSKQYDLKPVTGYQPDKYRQLLVRQLFVHLDQKRAL